jgi:hypothetical protein
MAHPLVDQLRFTRSEFVRALSGVTDEEARRRFLPMNCISWMIGHLAWQEQRYWLTRAAGTVLVPEINELAAYGAPASTPPLAEMWAAWRAITEAGDPFLDTLTTEMLTTFMMGTGQPDAETIGTRLRRTTYHYWYHTGESQAIRQMLGHTNLPEFVGDMNGLGDYRPEHS